jgi:hypothetical protein
MSQLAELPKPQPRGKERVAYVAPPPARRSGIRAGTLVLACFVCLFVGIMLGAMIR